MDNNISILNLDKSYEFQNFYNGFNYEFLDLLNIKESNSYCSDASLVLLENKLKLKKYKSITFIGSGNYHYITYLLTKDIMEPFSLVLFDNHTDMLKPSFLNLISCGSWVLNILQDNIFLRNILIIGVDNSYKKLIPMEYKNKIKVITHRDLKNHIDLSNVYKDFIHRNSIYISIDKDVLSSKYCLTNWDQGILTLDCLNNNLNYLMKNKKVLGVDICGEYTYNPSLEHNSTIDSAISLNNMANSKILNTIISSKS